MSLDTQSPSEGAADAPAAPAEREPGLFDGLGARLRRPRRPWLAALVVVLVVVLVAELYVRSLESKLPTLRAGDAAEMIVKTRQIDALVEDQGSQVDVVTFGTSMMDSATSPTALLERSTAFDTAYNASIVGAPLNVQVRWAEEVVLDRLDPDVIVLGIHPVDLLLTAVLDLNIESDQADVVFARVLRETGDGWVHGVDRAAHDHVALVRQRGVLRRPEVMWEATLDAVLRRKPRGSIPLRTEEDWIGYLNPLGESSQFAGQPFELNDVAVQLRDRFTVDAFSTVDLQRLIELVVDQDAEVVIVIPPIPLAAWEASGVDLGALEYGVGLIRAVAEEHGLTVIDFTAEAYPKELFADMLHSNDQGAQAFTGQLTPLLDAYG